MRRGPARRSRQRASCPPRPRRRPRQKATPSFRLSPRWRASNFTLSAGQLP
jgi:hypothetical protein